MHMFCYEEVIVSEDLYHFIYSHVDLGRKLLTDLESDCGFTFCPRYDDMATNP